MSKPKTIADRPTIVVIHGAGLLASAGQHKATKAAIGRAKVKPGKLIAHVHIKPGKGPKAK